MLVHFTKMHGLGNDFVVIDLITQHVRLHVTHIKRIASRTQGIGCDQVIIIEPPIRKTADFYYRIFNADGQEVEQCGNGARCVARFFYDLGFSEQSLLRADCMAGPVEFELSEDGMVRVNMGHPYFEPTDIPFLSETKQNRYPITIDNTELQIGVLSVGNPHAIILTEDLDTAPVKSVGSKLAKHPSFPNGTNVEFMKIIDRTHIQLRVYERGVGETKACGTGAVAAAIFGIQQGLLDSPVVVSFRQGDLMVEWSGPNHPIWMRGPTRSVFVGRFLL